MYYVYILQSEKSGKYYVGYTRNIEKRIQEHNAGKTCSLKGRGPFRLVYVEEYRSREEAYRRESQIKRYKSGEAFSKLIEYAQNTTYKSNQK